MSGIFLRHCFSTADSMTPGQTLRCLGPRVDGGPNDKASLTISRQEQGGERGKLNCQREKRREEEWRREEGGMGG
ncbi:hypothetical protein FQN60_018161, partial [Etheostoma spectabile]